MSDPPEAMKVRLRRRRCATTLAAALALAGWPSVAGAQVDVSWQAGASAQVGVTSNVAQTPDPDPDDPNAVQPEADGLAILSPTVALILAMEGTTHTLAYGFGTTLYFSNPDANAYSNGLTYASIYQLSETIDLALGAGVAITQTGAFNLLGGADATAVAAQPPGPVNVLSFGVNQGLEIALSEVWSMNQTVGATWIYQLDQPNRNYLVAASVGAVREFTFDALGVSAGVELLRQPEILEGIDDEGVATPAVPENTQVILRGTGTWTHELSERWRTTLAAGGLLGLQLSPVVDDDGVPIDPPPVLQPYGLASIDYVDEIGTAGLSIEHTVAPNLLVGSAQLTDTATLRLGVPLGQDTGFLASATGAAGMARNLGVDGTFGPRFLLFVADAGVSYLVPSLPELSFDLRYQLTKQMAADPDDPAADDAGLQAITRHTGLIGVAVTFPPANEGGGDAAAAVFRPTPPTAQDILGGVRDAREARERAAEEEERRGRGEKDTDGKYGPGEEAEE